VTYKTNGDVAKSRPQPVWPVVHHDGRRPVADQEGVSTASTEKRPQHQLPTTKMGQGSQTERPDVGPTGGSTAAQQPRACHHQTYDADGQG